MLNSDYSPDSPARFVYGIQSGQFIKIGVATNISKRLHTIRLSNPHPLKVVLKRKLRAAFYCERKMHEILKPKALGREWFDVSVEEVIAAADIGAAYAKQVHMGRRAREVAFAKSDTPETQRKIENSRNPYKMGTK